MPHLTRTFPRYRNNPARGPAVDTIDSCCLTSRSTAFGIPVAIKSQSRFSHTMN